MSGDHLVEPRRVGLETVAASREEAIRRAVDLLRGDPRVGPWEDFVAAVAARPIVDFCGGEICLAHGRGGAIKGLAFAAARVQPGPDAAAGVPRFVFVFGIPATMAEDYLRSVGALARVCGDPARVAALREAPSEDDFAGLLEKWIG
ncbi:MAG: PTS sugar transporter subunit IIA [Chthoniobacterales bacterium]|jgi:mannitol/fructose-specific phosphotransferase system IIA component (Ntr-type)